MPLATFVSSQLMAVPGSGVAPVPHAAALVDPFDRATVKPDGDELSGVFGVTHVTCTVRTDGFGTVAVTLVGTLMVLTAPTPEPTPEPVQKAHAVAAAARKPQMTPAARRRFLGFIAFPSKRVEGPAQRAGPHDVTPQGVR